MANFLEITLLIAANLMLVASFQNKTIFKDADIYNQVLPPFPFDGLSIADIKFCGLGNTTTKIDDLGILNGTDKCCQVHKECEEIIEPLNTLHSLFNPSILPKYICTCEQVFLDCLQDVSDMTSIVVGQAYFSVMAQCFAMDYPVVECVEYQEGILSKRCTKYKLDETKEQVWQFFDLPFYTMKDE